MSGYQGRGRGAGGGGRGDSRSESRGRGSGGGYGGDRGGSHVRGGGGRGPQDSRDAPPAPQDILTRTPPSEDNKLRQFEDACVKANASHTPKDDTELPRRPGYGTVGKAIVMRADFLELNFLDEKKSFHSYAVKMEPNPERARQKKEVLEHVLYLPKFRRVYASSDMSQEIVTFGALEDTSSFVVKLPGSGDTTRDFKISLSANATSTPRKILGDLRSSSQPYPLECEETTTRILNIALTRVQFYDDGIVTTGKGRQKFFWIDGRKQYSDLGGGLEVIRGFFSSVRLGADRLLLNLNVNHGTFYRPGPMSELTDAFVKEYGEDRELFHRYIKGLRVQVSHLPKEKDATGKLVYRLKSVWGVATPGDGRDKDKEKEFDRHPDRKADYHPCRVARQGSSPPNVEFWETDKTDPKKGNFISVAKYFTRMYNITRFGSRPVLNVGSAKRPVYVPQDVCTVPPGTPFSGDLGTTQRQAMIKFSCRRPRENYQSIVQDGLKVMGIANDKTRETNLDIGKELIAVPARVLPPPSLKYGNKQVRPSGGSWNLRGEKFTDLPRLPDGKWAVALVLNKQKLPRYQDQWSKTGQPGKSLIDFHNILKSLGFPWPAAERVLTFHYDNASYREIIQKSIVKCPFKFLLVLMFDNEEKAWNHLKWKAETVGGQLTHCCKVEKFIGANDQYMANNAMKVCLKLGGVCQSLDLPSGSAAYKIINKHKTMIVGLDVTHPTGMDFKYFPSISGIVASIDNRLGQWPGECRIQDKDKEEAIKQVGLMLEGRIMRWKAQNGALPSNIIVYRDGVSDGQYNQVMDLELNAIRDMFRRVYGASTSNHPRITFIIVTKRHHVRLFPCRGSDMDKNNNPLPGTVVDRSITRPALWDFYLVAQSAIMGTARPAHYVVMHDEIFRSKTVNPDGRAADVLQELTHNVCYMMGRCTRSVSYSTPAFLADKYCERARRWAKAYFQEATEIRGSRNHEEKGPKQEMLNLTGECKERMVYI